MAADAPNTDAAADGGAPATADPQDPLPESNWKWRRIFVFSVGFLSILALGMILIMLFGLGKAVLEVVERLSATRDVRALDQALEAVGAVIERLAGLGFWLVIIQIVNQFLYLIAPSAEQAVKMMQTVSAWKAGISTTSTARSYAPDGSSAAATTAAGPASPAPAPATEPVVEPARPEPPAAPSAPAAPTQAAGEGGRADTVTFPWEKDQQQ